jgi:predicted short-subunit dehydrogenase-like oxidoreductase (DUF2520 family)
MFTSVNVIGRGRVGSAIAARLEERGLEVRAGADVDAVLLCVPDRAVADVARSVEPGPWIGHTSGATPLRALEPHRRRFTLHPLQTFTRDRGPEQLDGAYAAVAGETDEALRAAKALARLLGLEPFAIEDGERALYHAGAVVASNYLVTLHRAASELVAAAGAPPKALEPLMRRTIDNGFELTGPLERGDLATVEAHLRAIRRRRPQLEPLYRTLADATQSLALA